MLFIGVDLAWGEKKSDGICFLESDHISATVRGYAYPQGDDDLIVTLRPWIDQSKEVLLTIDAPIICPNRTGTRPVDRLTHRMFHREHAACHPANSTKCPRPPRVLRKLRSLGVDTGWEIRRHRKLAAEVYPHPAMVRLFDLPRIVKYKKGGVDERRREFRRLQRLMRTCIDTRFPYLKLDDESKTLLNTAWSKPVEDRTDALFCALIGLWHWKHRGKRSEVIGNLKTGFILLPVELRSLPHRTE